jgi:hypothetical protein
VATTERCIGREGLDGDASGVRGRDQLSAIKQQGAASVDRQRRNPPPCSYFDGFARPITGTSKRMSWRGLATFTTTKDCPDREARGTLDRLVGAFHGFHGHAGAIADHHGLAQVESGNLPGDLPAVGDVRGFAHPERAGQARRDRDQRTQKRGGIHQPDAFRFQHPRDGPDQRIGIFERASESSSLASFQSGRIELKILLCFTCPAITAWVTPS